MATANFENIKLLSAVRISCYLGESENFECFCDDLCYFLPIFNVRKNVIL